jgi:uncharacterized repeat protein (TIGR03803 family)
MGKLDWKNRACAAVLLWATVPIGLSAQTFETVHRFDGTHGGKPTGALVQATSGNLYGTTDTGGSNNECGDGVGCGTVFEISPSGGPVKTLYSFCSQGGTACTDGANPQAGLVQGTGGNFYGTTQSGGAYTHCGTSGSCGTVFEITPGGAPTTLHSFDFTDGSGPGALVQATSGDFYGTTWLGGADGQGIGTVFKITPSGTLTTLYSFCPQIGCKDGASPTGLVQATNGNFYGTTYGGGAKHQGTVFKITPSGTLTTLYSFCSQTGCTDGSNPYAGLVQGTDGNLYGTTYRGGANKRGTVFKITPSGTLTTLYSFCSQVGCTDGEDPYAVLVEATDGNLYGTTQSGGANTTGCNIYGCGTVFKITSSGTLTTLYSLCSQSGCTDGNEPLAGLVQDTNGMFYGTTSHGGANATDCGGGGCGTVFSLSVGLGPFVKTQPASGKVGGFVEILGTNLTGSTSVSFNGTPAVFRVVLNSLIKTTVPAGATTGTVQVITPGGTFSSNVPFRVRP